MSEQQRNNMSEQQRNTTTTTNAPLTKVNNVEEEPTTEYIKVEVKEFTSMIAEVMASTSRSLVKEVHQMAIDIMDHCDKKSADALKAQQDMFINLLRNNLVGGGGGSLEGGSSSTRKRKSISHGYPSSTTQPPHQALMMSESIYHDENGFNAGTPLMTSSSSSCSSSSSSSVCQSSPGVHLNAAMLSRIPITSSSYTSSSQLNGHGVSKVERVRQAKNQFRMIFVRLLVQSLSFQFSDYSVIAFNPAYFYEEYALSVEDEGNTILTNSSEFKFLKSFFWKNYMRDPILKSQLNYRKAVPENVEAMLDMGSFANLLPNYDEFRLNSESSYRALFASSNVDHDSIRTMFSPPAKKGISLVITEEEGENENVMKKKSEIIYKTDFLEPLRILDTKSSKKTSRISKPLLQGIMEHAFVCNDNTVGRPIEIVSQFYKTCCHLSPSLRDKKKNLTQCTPDIFMNFHKVSVPNGLLRIEVREHIENYFERFFQQDLSSASGKIDIMPLLSGSTDFDNLISIESIKPHFKEDVIIEEPASTASSSESEDTFPDDNYFEVKIRVSAPIPPPRSNIVNLRAEKCTLTLRLYPDQVSNTFTITLVEDECKEFFRIYDRRMFVWNGRTPTSVTNVFESFHYSNCSAFPNAASFILSFKFMTSFDLWLSFLKQKSSELAKFSSEDLNEIKTAVTLSKNLLVVLDKWFVFLQTMYEDVIMQPVGEKDNNSTSHGSEEDEEADEEEEEQEDQIVMDLDRKVTNSDEEESSSSSSSSSPPSYNSDETVSPDTIDAQRVMALMNSFTTFGIPGHVVDLDDQAKLDAIPCSPRQSLFLKVFELVKKKMQEKQEEPEDEESSSSSSSSSSKSDDDNQRQQLFNCYKDFEFAYDRHCDPCMIASQTVSKFKFNGRKLGGVSFLNILAFLAADFIKSIYHDAISEFGDIKAILRDFVIKYDCVASEPPAKKRRIVSDETEEQQEE